MIRISKTLFFIAMISLLSGCIATHYGNMAGSAALSSPNFVYTSRNLIGEAEATYVFGIGGVARHSLVAEAKKDMLKNHPLKANQALANLSVSHKTTGFLGIIVVTVRCTVSADIVEFGGTPDGFSQTRSPEHLTQPPGSYTSIPDNDPEINEPATAGSGEFQPGESVMIVNYFNKPVEGKIISIKNNGYEVIYTTPANKNRIVHVLKYQLEKKSK